MASISVKEKLDLLRKAMKERGMDAYLIPSDDDHASEYVNAHYRFREWISGFTGSAGTVLVTREKAFLWTDGRYFLQAASELDGTGIELMKMGEDGVPSIKDFISDLAEDDPGLTLGFCGSTMTISTVDAIVKDSGIKVLSSDLADEIWESRPSLGASTIWRFPGSSSGSSFAEKLGKLRAELDGDSLLITDLAEIAWLFDLRGSDIECTPVFYSYALVSPERCILFTLSGALTKDLREELSGQGVELFDYDWIREKLGELCASGARITFDGKKTSYDLASLIRESGADFTDRPSPVELMKAVKNETEITSTINAHIKDGVAVTKFIFWLKNAMKKKKLPTELDCSSKLRDLRETQEGFLDLSFPTIAAYAEDGAVIHYEPTPVSDKRLDRKGFLLLDSGGHYMDGTTDITRTIALGSLTEKMKRYYTLVLKSHIDLAMAKFDKGTKGKDLDVIARKPLLDEGLDYAHGTGHGVGHVLSVHEGPNYISPRAGDAEIVPGMITSNEPGVYIEGEFGIRLENEVLCEHAPDADGSSGEWHNNSEYPNSKKSDSKRLEDFNKEASKGNIKEAPKGASLSYFFRTLTVVPFDREAILPELLTAEEKEWLNSYHQHVRNSLMLLLEPEESDWLMTETEAFR